MINNIIYFFNKNLNLINKYKISEEDKEDIFNNKINFYYILLEYILKDSYLIYKIKFLLETKKFFKENYHKIKRKNLEKDRLNTIIKLLDYYDTNILEKKSENSNIESKDNITKTITSNDKNNDLTSKNNNNSSNFFPTGSNKYNKEVQISSKPDQEAEKNEENGILKFEKKIGCHSKNEKAKTADFITEVNTKESNYFMSGGSNNIINIYKIDTYNYFSNIKLKEWPYNISVINNNKIACSKKEIILIEKNKKKNEFVMNQKIYKEESNLNYILGTINNKEAPVYYCCTDKGVMIISNLLAKIIEKTEYTLFKDLLIKSSFQIDNKIIVFKSNKIVSRGKNKLSFYNYISKKEIVANNIKEIYSFVYFANGLSVMPIDKKNPDTCNNNILLCACKKYSKKQRNGILIVNIKNIKNIKNIDNDKENDEYEFNSKFYDTKNFEVYCFCPLLLYKKEEEKKILNKKIIKEDTDYFLAGGFDKDRKSGIIKLYKIKINKYEETKIEFIRNIVIGKRKDFKRFKGPISCITQSSINGDILVTCWDGNIYLFKLENLLI